MSVKCFARISAGIPKIFNFIYWNCSFVRMGTSGLTAQAFGAGNFRECTNMLARALSVSAVMGVLMILLQYPVGELALWAMNGSEMTRDYFYARIWAVPAGIVLFGFNGWFTGMQNAIFPMLTAVTVNIVHILCSLWFAFGMDMGIVGIAYASVIAQWTGVALSALLLAAKYRPILTGIDWSEVLDLKPLKTFFIINRDIIVRTLCIVAVYTFFTGASARMEDRTLLAVNTLLLQLFTLFSYMNDGFAYAAEALTGRFIGARDSVSLRDCLRRCIAWGTLVSVVFVGIYLVWWRDLVGVFVDHSAPNAGVIEELAGRYIVWIILIPIASAMPFIMGTCRSEQHARSRIIDLLPLDRKDQSIFGGDVRPLLVPLGERGIGRRSEGRPDEAMRHPVTGRTRIVDALRPDIGQRIRATPQVIFFRRSPAAT